MAPADPTAPPQPIESDRIDELLIDLLRKFRAQSNIPRRAELRVLGQHHDLYQHDPASSPYATDLSGFEVRMEDALPDEDRNKPSVFALNFFGAYALTFIAILSTARGDVLFWPDDSDNEGDRRSAALRNSVWKWFRQTEMPVSQVIQELFYLFLEGGFGSYVRTVQDGRRWGYVEEEMSVVADVSVRPALFTCSKCGMQNIDGGACLACGTPLADAPDVPAETMQSEVGTGEKQRRAVTRTVRDVISLTCLTRPPAARTIWDFPYLFYDREVDVSEIRAAYPEMADLEDPAVDGTDDASEGFARRLRLREAQGRGPGGTVLPINPNELVTFTEAWLSRTALFGIKAAAERQAVLAMFPDGVYVAMTVGKILDRRNEDLAKHWRFCYALPGLGQIRPAICAPLVTAQDLAVTIANIMADLLEYNLPLIFSNPACIDSAQFANSRAVPGEIYDVKPAAGSSVEDAFHTIQAGEPASFALAFFQHLHGPVMQFLSGVFPAAFGSHGGGNNTAQGMQLERDSAMGRIAIWGRGLGEHAAEVAGLVVEDFARNGRDPVKLVDRNPAGEFRTETIRPADLLHGASRARPEGADDYPTSWAQRQALIMEMSKNPMYSPLLTALTNAEFVSSTLGHGLSVPGLPQYKAAFSTIGRLLGQSPIPQDPVPVQGVGPDGGPMMIMQPQPPLPSEAIDPMEDPGVNIFAAVDFAFSAAGRTAKASNSEGWQNFMAWVMANQAKMPPPPQAGGNGGSGGSSSGG